MRILPILVAAGLLAAPAIAQQSPDGWYRITGDDEMVIYVYGVQDRTDAGNRLAIVSNHATEPFDTDGHAFSVNIATAFDCEARTFQRLMFRTYALDGSELGEMPSANTAMRPIAPDSIHALIADFVCDGTGGEFVEDMLADAAARLNRE